MIRQNHIGDWGTQFGMLITNLQDKSGSATDTELRDLEAFYVQAKKRFDDDPDFQKRARMPGGQQQPRAGGGFQQ